MSEAMTAVKMEDISPVKKKITFDVPWQDVKKEMDAVYQKVNRTANVKGFRKGKVPRNILETLYKDSVEKETAINLIERLYVDALRSNDVLPACQPQIEEHGIQYEKDFNFVATVEVEPVIEPKDYKDIVLEKVEREVTDKDVEEKLEEFRQRLATIEELKEDRCVQNGDYIMMDFSGTVDGVSRKELCADNFPLEIGSKRFIPGFEEQLVGIAKGATQEVNVRFPDDYHVTEIAGKDAIFTVTVKDIREKKLPVLDESFIKNFAQFETMEELKGDIRQNIEAQYRVQSQNNLHNSIVAELLKNNEFEAPDCYVEREYQYVIADVRSRMAMEGISKERAEEMRLKYDAQYRQAALRMVKLSALLRSIARKESINVSEDDIRAKIEEIASKSRDYDAVQKYFADESIIANLAGELLNKKVLEFIENNARITVTKETIPANGEDS